jgi:hypothetical protein
MVVCPLLEPLTMRLSWMLGPAPSSVLVELRQLISSLSQLKGQCRCSRQGELVQVQPLIACPEGLGAWRLSKPKKLSKFVHLL